MCRSEKTKALAGDTFRSPGGGPDCQAASLSVPFSSGVPAPLKQLSASRRELVELGLRHFHRPIQGEPGPGIADHQLRSRAVRRVGRAAMERAGVLNPERSLGQIEAASVRELSPVDQIV